MDSHKAGLVGWNPHDETVEDSNDNGKDNLDHDTDNGDVSEHSSPASYPPALPPDPLPQCGNPQVLSSDRSQSRRGWGWCTWFRRKFIHPSISSQEVLNKKAAWNMPFNRTCIHAQSVYVRTSMQLVRTTKALIDYQSTKDHPLQRLMQ